MPPPDDLHPDLPPASAGVAPKPPGALKEVGPESEVRGGPEAPDTTPPPNGDAK